MPYTIVFTLPIDQSMKYVEASQALYSYCQPSYLLSADGASSPHITVVQFDFASPKADIVLYFRFNRILCLWRTCKRLFFDILRFLIVLKDVLKMSVSARSDIFGDFRKW